MFPPESDIEPGAAPAAAAEPAAERVLSHPTRRILYELIRDHWGICETELGKLSSLGRNNIKYHLQRLVRVRLIQPQPMGRKVHYFPRDVRALELQRAIVSAQSATRREILDLVRHNPALSWRAVSKVVGITPRAVRWHMKELTRAGLVAIERDGMYCRARLSPTLIAVLDGETAELARGFDLVEGGPVRPPEDDGVPELRLVGPPETN